MTYFSREQSEEILALLARPPQDIGAGRAEQFLLRYVFFEALIRLVDRNYRDRNGKSKKTTAHVVLKLDVMKRAFEHYGISITHENLELLLDSKRTKRSHKSARNLRNGLVHQWGFEDSNEVVNRFDILTSTMKAATDSIVVRVQDFDREL